MEPSQKARLAHILVCANSTRRRRPPTKVYSVLQSNWKASPCLNFKGINAAPGAARPSTVFQTHVKGQARP